MTHRKSKNVKSSLSDIPGFVTVRASSTRLPGKCLLPFGKGNVLNHVIQRARQFGVEPIVCTSTSSTDDIIEQIAITDGARVYRGSLVNKLKRWSDCALHFGIDAFHTVDADDPFFDGEEIHRSMELLAEENLDMVAPTLSSSAGGASVGYSLKSELVKKVSDGIPADTDTEMMWYYMEKVGNLRKKILPDINPLPFNIRLTLDYQEDYWLLSSIQRMIGGEATRHELNQLFLKNPDLYKINWFRNEEWEAGQLSKKI